MGSVTVAVEEIAVRVDVAAAHAREQLCITRRR
jgi:hypothetical protein